MKKISTALTVILIFTLLMLGTSAKTVLKGDFNQDGKITAADARSTLRASAKLDIITDEQSLIVDTNNDNKVTATDARTILRRAAGLEKDLGEVEIPDENEQPTETPAVKTEVSGGIGGTTSDFIKKYGGMRQIGTSDNTIRYTNDKVTIISDPEMVFTGNVSNIILTGDGYTLCGVYIGMSGTDAVNILKTDRWTVKEQNSAEITLSKNAMVLVLTLTDGNVTKAEYKFAFALVSPTDPAETTTKEPATTTPAETTTNEPETTTKPTETTTNAPETTTKQEEPTTQPIEGNVTYDELPAQIKTFLSGKFGLTGYNYSQGKKNLVSMYVSPENVKAGMGLDTGNGNMALDILITDVDDTKKSKTYILVPDTKQYCELSSFAMSLLGLKAEDLQLSIAPGSSNIKSINKTDEKSAGVDYVVYTVNTGTEYCKLFTIDGEIKRVETYGISDNVMKSRIDVTEFYSTVPASAFSLDGYKEKSFISLFGNLI